MKTIIGIVLIMALALTGAVGAAWWNASQEQSAAAQSANPTGRWTTARIRSERTRAQQYNRQLAQTGQPSFGEAVDPFATSSSVGASDGGSPSDNDAEYQSQLDVAEGRMGGIRIPKISVNLPIYHGTGERSLDAGVGHLYGSSLPVGGTDTHVVLTAHRGLAQALMFTRLDELSPGDYFYLDVLSDTLAYRVDSVTVIEPDDFSGLRIKAGEDRVTLMTCTPYGINSHRLLVSGVRVQMPTEEAHDSRAAIAGGLIVTLIAFICGRILALPYRRRLRKTNLSAQHASRAGM